jgi:hypothetical protein
MRLSSKLAHSLIAARESGSSLRTRSRSGPRDMWQVWARVRVRSASRVARCSHDGSRRTSALTRSRSVLPDLERSVATQKQTIRT